MFRTFHQAAFLSTLVGVDVAEVAARAALAAVSALGDGKLKECLKLSSGAAKQQGMSYIYCELWIRQETNGYALL